MFITSYTSMTLYPYNSSNTQFSLRKFTKMFNLYTYFQMFDELMMLSQIVNSILTITEDVNTPTMTFSMLLLNACDRRMDGQNYDSQDCSSIAASRGKKWTGFYSI